MAEDAKLTPEQIALKQASAENYDELMRLRDVTMRDSTGAIHEASKIIAEHKASAEAAAENAKLHQLAADAAAAVAGTDPREIARTHYLASKAEAAATDAGRRLVQKLARVLAPSSVMQLALIGADPLQPGAVRVAAFEKLLDRGIGKTIPMTPLPEPINHLPIADAVTKLGEWVAQGLIPQNEIEEHTKLLRMRIEAVTIAEMQERLDRLEGNGVGPAPIRVTPAALN